jgi:hypothetical protein
MASNPGGSTSSSNAIVLIRVPQHLTGALQPDGTFAITSGDADGNPLTPGDLGNFKWQASSNLLNWTMLRKNPVLTNGVLLLIDINSTNFPKRFYRVIEH